MQKIKIHDEVLANLLETPNSYNFVIIEGMNRINQGKEIGKYVSSFLEELGVIEVIIPASPENGWKPKILSRK